MKPKATGYNPLSGSIICPSVRPVVCGPFSIFVFVFNSFNNIEMLTITITITSVGVHRCDVFIPVLGYGGPPWGPVKIMCLYVYMSLSLSLCLYICLSVPMSGHPRRFLMIIISRAVIAHSTCGRMSWGQIP